MFCHLSEPILFLSYTVIRIYVFSLISFPSFAVFFRKVQLTTLFTTMDSIPITEPQSRPPSLDIEDLLSKLDLDEKIALISGQRQSCMLELPIVALADCAKGLISGIPFQFQG